MLFDPDFSDPPLLPVSTSYFLIRHMVCSHCTCSIWCASLERCFVFLAECMWSAQSQSALPRQRSGVLHPHRENSSYKL
ncbi:unnamed protein product [Staurois parvus]|uniref:Uncharacterized protein n=1 Tax=Staurois parvus TaxID=386267 RepID=A0ABN9BJY3_9NEOB|nr:unnamed protein product [Staurois parvus]